MTDTDTSVVGAGAAGPGDPLDPAGPGSVSGSGPAARLRGALTERTGDRLGAVTGATARLLEAVAELVATPSVELGPVESLLRTEAVLAARTALRAVELDGVLDADTRELYALRQAGSVGTWLGGLPSAAGGGSRVRLARRLAASPTAHAALSRAQLAPVAVERILTSVDALPARLLEDVAAGLTGNPLTPSGREVGAEQAADAAARYTAVLTDGLRELIGVPPPDTAATVDTDLTALLTGTPGSAPEVAEQLTGGLVLLARHVHPRHLRHCIDVLLDALTPPADPTDGDPHWDSRHLHLSDLLDGWGRVEGDLPPEVFRLLRARLEAHVRDARARAAAQQAAATAADEAAPLLPLLPPDPALTDPRPEAQDVPDDKPSRRPTGKEYADALADLLRDTGADDDPADQPPVAPTAADDADAAAADVESAIAGVADRVDGGGTDLHDGSVTADRVDSPSAAPRTCRPTVRPAPRRFRRRSWAPLTPVAIVVPAGRLTRRAGALAARTADGHRVSDAAIASAVCHAGLTALLTDPRGIDLDAAAHQRNANAAQRAALNVIWGGHCATYGCGRPGTVPHHVVPWHLHGLTIMSNLRPLCEGCHDDLHLGARTLRLRDGTAICPTGWALPPPDL